MEVILSKCICIINRNLLHRKIACVRNISFRSVKESLYSYFRSDVTHPPYKHICQLGDPVLRMQATPVNPKDIQTEDFQKLLELLCSVMRSYEAVGLSAPQIGIPLQVFVMEIPTNTINQVDPKYLALYEMEAIPLTYFINPVMKIVDPTKIKFPELCGSVNGYQGEVLRSKEIEMKALNPLGKVFVQSAKGWTARIMQHEYDHLQGTLYVDKMDLASFQCSYWQHVNRFNGKIEIRYTPRKRS